MLVFGWALLTNWLVIIAAFLTRTPVLLYGESPEMHETKRKGIYKAVRRALLKGLFLLIDGFMYIGSENKKFYQSMGVKDSKLFFCPYSVDNDRHYMAAKKLMSDKERVNDYELKKDMTIILFVGKLIEKKRPMDLLQAFHLMEGRGSRKKAMLWFVGDGQQREDLERYAEENHLDNVAFMGFQNQTELPYFYFMSDVFVLPSGYGETWGLVVNEAMCYSLPVIVSDRVGCGGDLVTSKNGYIFEYSNKKQLAQCLDRLVSDSSLRESFGSESLRVIRKYNQDLAANNILEAANSVSCK